MKRVKINNLKQLDFFSEEAYMSLETNIAFCGDNVKVIAITSTSEGEGKSEVSMRLSKTMAENGKKVLLVDCDLRKSKMIAEYRIEGVEKGLSHYLSGQIGMESIINSTNIEGLHFINAGRMVQRPVLLLKSDRMRKLLESVREEYDVIIIDTPPVGTVVDLATFAQYCDGVVLVLESGKTSRRKAMSVVKYLNQIKVNILGTVLNKSKISRGKEYK